LSPTLLLPWVLHVVIVVVPTGAGLRRWLNIVNDGGMCVFIRELGQTSPPGCKKARICGLFCKAEVSDGMCFIGLFPLNGRRWLARYVVDHPVYSLYFIDDAIGDTAQQ